MKQASPDVIFIQETKCSIQKLEEIEQNFLRLEKQIADPDVLGDHRKLLELTKTRSQLEPTVEAFREYKTLKEQGREAEVGIVGRDGIEPNVWYRCVGGKLVAA